MSAQLELVVTAGKECSWCHQWKPLTAFGRHRKGADGRQRVCKDCFAKNERENHLAQAAAPRTRRSPYDVIADELDSLELVARARGDVLGELKRIREELKL